MKKLSALLFALTLSLAAFGQGPITGMTSVCTGFTTVLNDTTAGGTWSSANSSVATVGSSTGVVTGVVAGTATITYSVGAGTATTVVTVNPQPGPILGSLGMCFGDTITLSDVIAGGTWSSSNPAVADIAFGAGVVTTVSAGTATISYILPTGCFTTSTLTVNPLPGGAILGVLTVCAGLSTALSDGVTGGTWSSGLPIIGTVDSSGIVTGIAAGSTTITYEVSSGCIATAIVTVYPVPPIGGSTYDVCVGATITLTDVTGGLWLYSSSLVTVGSSTGIVTGISAGTATVTFALSTGCTTTTVVTVNPAPSAITGIAYVCSGFSTALNDSAAGGIWSSSNSAIATISSSSGLITTVSTGTATISYTLPTGCSTSVILTVNPSPTAILGLPGICSGGMTTLSDPVTGGSWTSSNSVVAVAGTSGIVYAVGAGTTIITYALGACYSTKVVTVNPSVTAIGGLTDVVCSGVTITLTDVTGGGIWSSGNTVIATVGSNTGIVLGGATTGTAMISYTFGTGCVSVTVVTVDAAPLSISGFAGVCAGSAITLIDTTTGGLWSSSNIAIGTIGSSSGIVMGIIAGTTTISYTLSSGCYRSVVITVNPMPGIISGGNNICTGSFAALSDATAGGNWSSSNIAIAAIGATGVVTGISTGFVTITYALPTGCYTLAEMTVNPTPEPIMGSTGVCAGASVTLSDVDTGGIWSSGSGIATISVTGIVTGILPGTAAISYTLSTSCYNTIIVTVNALPDAIYGTGTVCAGATSPLYDSSAGGNWSDAGTSVATIGATTGVVTGILAGTAIVSYTVSSGCYVSQQITVNPLPSPISGASGICVGDIDSLSDTGIGTWSSSDTVIAPVTGGSVLALSAGSVTITYMAPTGCIATYGVTIYSPAPITGPSDDCVSQIITLSDTAAGGSWSSSDVAIAEVGTLDGVVTGVSAGSVIITYSLGAGCRNTAIITINPVPAPVSGPAFVCVGSTAVLNDTTEGGTWNSSNTGVATISVIGGTSGEIIGISDGTIVVTYSFSTGCQATTVITVNTSPAISASATLNTCGGLYLATASGGDTYSWSPTTGVSCDSCGTTYIDPGAAIYVVTGTLAGCSGTAFVTVNNNRIYGHLSYGGPTPASLNSEVWLIQYNPADSSVIAIDTMLTCLDGELPYYEFDSVPAGNYFVQAALLSSVPGISGYAPTYGTMNPHWDSATTVTHTGGPDSLRVTMIYGLVHGGSGVISGDVVIAFGSGTIPAQGMLVYLLDSSYNVITYAYTDGSGSYSFGGLANGAYIVYPEYYDYYTTPSGVITINYTSDSVGNIDFIQNTVVRTIIPYYPSGIAAVALADGFSMFPNPATDKLNIKWTNQALCDADIVVTDMLGREVYRTVLKISATNGQALLDINGWEKGIYSVSVRSSGIDFTGKLLIGE